MTFVKHRGNRWLLTAGHVADWFQKNSWALAELLVRSEVSEQDALQGVTTTPLPFRIDLRTPAWRSTAHDVALYEAPRALKSLRYLRWFDSEESCKATARVREQWSKTTPLPTFIMGCPDFGHFKEVPNRLETLSFLAVPAWIRALAREPASALCSPAAIHLEVQENTEPIERIAEGMRKRIIQKLGMQKLEPESSPFGGFSGGPFVVIGENEEHLIGTVTEGRYVFSSSPRATASPFDEVWTAFETETRSTGW